MSVFTPDARDQIRETLVSAARADARISAAATIGSAALDREDRWSDIDLGLCLESDEDTDEVINDWTERMYQDHHAVQQLDVKSGKTLYRVFLLGNTLQVDLSFWSSTEFGATGSAFRLLFGTANEPPHHSPPSATDVIGMGWLYALHVRSSIARGRLWQAEFMLSALRDRTFELACLHHGTNPYDGRGMDDLPSEITAPLRDALVRSLDDAELRRAFAVTMNLFLREIERSDAVLAARLSPVLEQFTLVK